MFSLMHIHRTIVRGRGSRGRISPNAWKVGKRKKEERRWRMVRLIGGFFNQLDPRLHYLSKMRWEHWIYPWQLRFSLMKLKNKLLKQNLNMTGRLRRKIKKFYWCCHQENNFRRVIQKIFKNVWHCNICP